MAAYSKSSWNSFTSVNNLFKKFESDKGSKFPNPISESVIISFVEWMFYKRNLSQSTIKSYISNLATICKLEGKSSSNFESFHVKASLRGVENLSFNKKSSRKPRKAMSLSLLKIMGHEIAKKDWTVSTKSVIWTTMCVAFFGSFRIGELLAKSDFKFNSCENLCWGDVKFLKDGSIQIHNKIPKNRTIAGEKIDLFPFPGSCCPVSAMNRLHKTLPGGSLDPVFKFASGKLFSQRLLNEIIVECLKPHLGNKASDFSGHSFRAALPSALSSCHYLASKEAIKKWGRWKSNAFEKYVRLDHSAKKEVFALFSKALLHDK